MPRKSKVTYNPQGEVLYISHPDWDFMATASLRPDYADEIQSVTWSKNGDYLYSSTFVRQPKVKAELKTKAAEKKELIGEQKNCGIHFIRASKLCEQIAALTEDVEELKFRKAQLLSRLNCQDNGIASQDKKVKEMDTFLGKLEQQHITLSEQKEADKAQFLEIRDGITPESKDAVMAEREAIRPNGKVGLVQKLYAVYKDKYRSEIFDEANRQIDIELQEKPVLKKKRSLSEQLKVPHQDIQRSKKQKKKEYER